MPEERLLGLSGEGVEHYRENGPISPGDIEPGDVFEISSQSGASVVVYRATGPVEKDHDSMVSVPVWVVRSNVLAIPAGTHRKVGLGPHANVWLLEQGGDPGSREVTGALAEPAVSEPSTERVERAMGSKALVGALRVGDHFGLANNRYAPVDEVMSVVEDGEYVILELRRVGVKNPFRLRLGKNTEVVLRTPEAGPGESVVEG